MSAKIDPKMKPGEVSAEATRQAWTKVWASLERLRRLLGETSKRRREARLLSRHLRRLNALADRTEAALFETARTHGDTGPVRIMLGRVRDQQALTRDRLANARRGLRLTRLRLAHEHRMWKLAEAKTDPASIALRAQALSEAVRQARHGRRRASAEVAALGLTRDGPTPERLAKASAARVNLEGAARLGDDVPETLRRLARSGMIGDAQLRAAGRWRADWLFGSTRGAMVQSWEIRVDGGRKGGAVSEDRREAWARFAAGLDAMPASVAKVCEAVILHEVTLSESPGPGEAYSAGSDRRRAAAAAVLVVGCDLLKAFYDNASGRC